MIVTNIGKLAKHMHAKLLLATLGVATCFAIGGTTLSTTQASTHDIQLNTLSTKLAKKTDLGETLADHKMHSKQFTDLLVHQFQEQSDSDIGNVPSVLSKYSTTTKSDALYKLQNGYVKAYGHKTNSGNDSSDKAFSVVESSDNTPPESNQMTYFVTKHNLLIREMDMGGQPNRTVRLVKYHLHSIAEGTDGENELVFYPVEFSKKHGDINIIPKSQRHNYPMHLYVTRGGTHISHTTKKVHGLLP